MTYMNTRLKKWKYIVDFVWQDHCRVEAGNNTQEVIFQLFEYIDDHRSYSLVVSEDTFSKLLLRLAIAGIDPNDVNFNKVSMIDNVEKALDINKINHLRYSHDDSESEWVLFDD